VQKGTPISQIVVGRKANRIEVVNPRRVWGGKSSGGGGGGRVEKTVPDEKNPTKSGVTKAKINGRKKNLCWGKL